MGVCNYCGRETDNLSINRLCRICTGEEMPTDGVDSNHESHFDPLHTYEQPTRYVIIQETKIVKADDRNVDPKYSTSSYLLEVLAFSLLSMGTGFLLLYSELKFHLSFMVYVVFVLAVAGLVLSIRVISKLIKNFKYIDGANLKALSVINMVLNVFLILAEIIIILFFLAMLCFGILLMVFLRQLMHFSG